VAVQIVIAIVTANVTNVTTDTPIVTRKARFYSVSGPLLSEQSVRRVQQEVSR
jgi:hypothetical protein